MQCVDFHEREHSFGTEYPIASLQWALFGMKDVISTTHMDAGGFLTFVRTILGKKVWIVGLGHQAPDSWGFDPEEGSGMKPSDDTEDAPPPWQAVLLNPGDDL